jgi:hypothetical protein
VSAVGLADRGDHPDASGEVGDEAGTRLPDLAIMTGEPEWPVTTSDELPTGSPVLLAAQLALAAAVANAVRTGGSVPCLVERQLFGCPTPGLTIDGRPGCVPGVR